MSKLVWDRPQDKIIESGLDRGVLYPNMGEGCAWNGLTSVVESAEGATRKPVYIDGVKVSDRVLPHNYSAKLSAYTYPDEFLPCLGMAAVEDNFYADEQAPIPFGLSYRTLIQDAVGSKDLGYKIHLIYNARAIFDNWTHETLSDQNLADELSWDIAGVPVALPGRRPAVHYILKPSKARPESFAEFERVLYGHEGSPPRLPMPDEVHAYFRDDTILYPSHSTYPSANTYTGAI